MALGGVGVTARIDDVDNDTSTEAYNCRLFYDQCVSQILETKEWPFACVRVPLADLGTPPADWAFRYKYPTDCALALKIVNPYMRTPGTDERIPFKVRKLTDAYGKAIFCDLKDAELEYNQAITDPNLFSSAFIQAVSMCLSSYIAMPLRVDPKIAAYAAQQFNGWLEEATNLSLREQQEDPYPQSQFQTARS